MESKQNEHCSVCGTSYRKWIEHQQGEDHWYECRCGNTYDVEE